MMYRLLPLLLLCSLGLLLLPAGAQPTTTRELYVKPTEDTPCLEPCHTLDEYVQNATQYFLSNTTFNFLPGSHSLSQPLNMSSVVNLAMVAINGTVNIMFKDGLYPYFTEISNLTLKSLTLHSCNQLVLTNLLDLSLLDITLSLSGNIPSYTLNATNVLGNFTIARLRIVPPISTSISIQYNDNLFTLPLTHNQLTVKDVTFSFLSTTSIGIVLSLTQSTYGVTFWFDNVTIATYVYAVQVDLVSVAPYVDITLINSHFKSLSRPSLVTLPAISFLQYTSNSNTSVHIKSCIFSHVHLQLMSTQLMIEDTLMEDMATVISIYRPSILKNVTFATGFYTEVQNVPQVLLKKTTYLKFVDCKFVSISGSGMPSHYNHSNLQNSVVLMNGSSNVSFTNCEFSNNKVTPIVSLDSTFILSGSNTFSNNRAPQGGAMAFYGQSYVTLANDSHTLFLNNLVETVGGGIYVQYNASCFFTFEGQYSCLDAPATMTFVDNHAENGGSAVYGASLDTCVMINTSCQGWKFIYNLTHIDQRNGSILSAITSEPLRACVCDENGKPSCGRVFIERTVFPGEPFNVSAVVVGDRFGTVDGSVYAHFLPVNGPYWAELGSSELSQWVTYVKCTNLSYTILSNSSANVSMAFTANNTKVHHLPNDETMIHIHNLSYKYQTTGYIDPILRTFPVFINITLLPCPLGFILSGEPYQCICDTRLQDNHIPCNLTTQTVQRSGTEWVNASFHNNTSNGVIVSKYCPNNYCKTETVNISLEHPDTQCASNHSGILCGGCQSGLSLPLGSAQCLSCSNDYLALLIPFTLAGFALVFFIKLLNLTVARGTLNGLIFYANIIRANQSAWIPAHHTSVLTVFIAWLNLDLGIKTCFFDGLDAYWKTWLQFVFPLYIWAIVILIIILSRYSSTAAKIFGSNSVPVLATLFLLSYSKLLRTIISIFHISTLEYPDGTSSTVWSYDGNIPYFSAKHIPLILVALVVLLFLWLPYTGVLLFAQYLQRCDNYKIAAFLIKFKPILDAYFGPLKDTHRYWVGLLLLVRGVLFVVYAATPTSKAGIDLLATAVVMLCLLVYRPVGYVYRKTYLNLLENSFLLNIGALAVGTLYIRDPNGSQAALAYTSMGIALTVFAGVVLFHSLAGLGATRWVSGQANRYLNILCPQQANQDRENYELIREEQEANRPGVRGLRITLDEYREPVLRYLDEQ